MYSNRNNRQSRQHGGPGPAFIRPGYPRRRLSGAEPIPAAPYIRGQATAPREVVAYARLHGFTDLGLAASVVRGLQDDENAR